ncbi:DUF3732 domain-containing protein [Streptomyces sp. SceaMP-e96]|uniref:DUF3732 domain-containing protein n=1 Tax=Streptomyces sp. SceaMP-e96 TaxID=1100824 RepID=UPI00406CF40F
MLATLADLRGQLDSVRTTRPGRERALRELQQETDQLRQQLRGVEGALSALSETEADRRGLQSRAEEQAYARGRIDAYLAQLDQAGPGGDLARLRSQITLAEQVVTGLEAELDPQEVEDRLSHSLNYISSDMTQWADRLKLEHGTRHVRLDLKRLTVVTDSDEGVAELMRIGSGKNWVGYHLVAHLALHQYFVAHGRPIPRLLMLDQPTQPYYPSDVARLSGAMATALTPSTCPTRVASRRWPVESQSLTVWSSLAVTRVRPSGAKARVVKSRVWPPRRVAPYSAYALIRAERASSV